MSRPRRDGTAEPVSRDQILRDVRGQGNINFPCSADHDQDWQLYPVDPYSAIYICDDHTCCCQSFIDYDSSAVYMRPDSHTEQSVTCKKHIVYLYLCVSSFSCLFFVFNGLFSGVLCTIAFYFSMGRSLYVFLPNSVFLSCEPELNFDISLLCSNSINRLNQSLQSFNRSIQPTKTSYVI